MAHPIKSKASPNLTIIEEPTQKGSRTRYTRELSRRTSQILTLLLLCVCAISWGCAPEVEATCSDDGSATFVDQLIITDAQFSFVYPGRSDLLPSNGFWFSGADVQSGMPVVYGWNSVNLRLREPDAADNCSFESGSGDGCFQCNLCVEGLAECNNNTQKAIIDASAPLVTLTEFNKDTMEETALRQFPDPGHGCVLRPNLPALPSFGAAKNAVVSVRKNHPCRRPPEEIAKFETTVVHTTRTFKATPEPYHDAADPGVRRYMYKMPETGGRLDQNFSPFLRVAKVRVLRGKFDESTGKDGEHPDTPDLRLMRPSRILFLPSFQPGNVDGHVNEGTNRCYIDQAADDGNFDLRHNCRKDPNSAVLQPHDATLTYMDANGLRGSTLSWIIEYKESDGLPSLPDLSDGSFPILEFTIEVR